MTRLVIAAVLLTLPACDKKKDDDSGGGGAAPPGEPKGGLASAVGVDAAALISKDEGKEPAQHLSHRVRHWDRSADPDRHRTTI